MLSLVFSAIVLAKLVNCEAYYIFMAGFHLNRLLDIPNWNIKRNL